LYIKSILLPPIDNPILFILSILSNLILVQYSPSLKSKVKVWAHDGSIKYNVLTTESFKFFLIISISLLVWYDKIII